MIRSLRANQPSFKSVRFSTGLNIVLAERTREASDKDSRNGLGKSLLIDVIHFCLGGDGLPADDLRDWSFTLDLDLSGRPVRVTRSVANPRGVDVEGLEGSPDVARLDLREWNAVLGASMFAIDASGAGPYAPTFRSLLSYFARRGKKGFLGPFTQHDKQTEVDKQVAVANLLGLSWEDARDAQLLKDRAKGISQLKKGVKDGFVHGFETSRGELEAAVVRLSETVDVERRRLDTFKVHPQYTAFRGEADGLTSRIHEAANRAVSLKQVLTVYEKDLDGVTGSEGDLVERVYEEAGVVFPDRVRRTLSDARAFHEAVVAHRRAFLQEEILRLRAEIETLDGLVASLSDQRAGIMEILKTHGALEEFTALERRHLESVQEVNRLRGLIDNWKHLESSQSKLKIEQETLVQRGRRDYDERKDARAQAVSLFNANSQALYEAPGTLQIEFGPTGFKFAVDIERSGSDGIENMKIFCFDLMLAQLWSRNRRSPGFLIHDSRLFDGVDERQKAKALQLAARASEDFKFQYICSFNSDEVPVRDLDPGFQLEKYVRLRLTDADPSGSLFGFRF